MPTENPRISVTLQPAVHAVLAEMSKLTGTSQSAIVGDLLREVSPTLERVVKLLRAAETAKATLNAGIASGLSSAQSAVEGQLSLLNEEMGSFMADLVGEAERVGRRTRGANPSPRSGGGVAADAAHAAPHNRVTHRKGPPSSNRGVRYPGRTTKVQKAGGKPRKAGG